MLPITPLRARLILQLRDIGFAEAERGEKAGDDEHLVFFASLWIMALALLEPDPTGRAVLFSQLPETPGDALTAMHG